MKLWLDATPSDLGMLSLRTRHDVIGCRLLVGKLAQRLDFSIIGRTMLVTAASELARNVIVHGGGGSVTWDALRDGPLSGIRLEFRDNGPGIADLERALTDGWSSGTGLGLGLSGARRLVHEFDIDSTPESGTRVLITRWRRLPPAPNRN